MQGGASFAQTKVEGILQQFQPSGQLKGGKNDAFTGQVGPAEAADNAVNAVIIIIFFFFLLSTWWKEQVPPGAEGLWTG